jgi:hypothetical protein
VQELLADRPIEWNAAQAATAALEAEQTRPRGRRSKAPQDWLLQQAAAAYRRSVNSTAHVGKGSSFARRVLPVVMTAAGIVLADYEERIKRGRTRSF